MLSSAATDLTPRWVVNPRDHETEGRLQKELGVPALVAAILAQRGMKNPDEAHRFLNPCLDELHDPALLPDYDAARDAILGARERNELIFVHGDYDVDGVTSAAILSRFLQAIGCRVHAHVPHRMKEGYGIHRDAVAAAHELGAKLFLTCDCGIGAHDQVALAHEAGMKVVVTDHHTVGSQLPDAEAVVNPHRTDSRYPFTELSGAGVAFKLCEGLTRDLGHPVSGYYRAFLDLAALGTIADVMPLQGENRVIARFGLERLAETKKVGIQALMREANVVPERGKPLRARQVGWGLGPRLNAAGRIDDAALSLRLLLSTDPDEAGKIAAELEAVNAARKSETHRIVDEAVEMVLAERSHERNVIVVAREAWHSGIVGIAAGRLVERFNRPAFVLTVNPTTGMCKGSARTIPNFHLADAIRAHGDLMEGGGHALAAGCSFPAERLEAVRDALDAYAGEHLTDEDFRPAIYADMEVTTEEVSLAGAEALSHLEPFGCDNPEPVFLARGVTLAQITPTRNPAHARLLLRQGTTSAVPGIAFNLGERLTQTGTGSTVDLLFQPNVDEYRGMRQLKWQVRDYTAAQAC